MIHVRLLALFAVMTVVRINITGYTHVKMKPSFESNWYEIVAQDKVKSHIVIPHDLGEYPVKVDVQVKVIVNSTEYIFTGIGSSYRDDDFCNNYGATVYIYNQFEVIVTVPLKSNDCSNGGIAYSGGRSMYHGSHEVEGPYYNGFVKVRAWRATDLPPILFNMSVVMDTANTYNEIPHNLGFYPDIVSVQTLMSTGYISEGQGSVLSSKGNWESSHTGGIVYGYDKQRIKLWASNIALFSTNDGWGVSQVSKTGTVFILGWKIDDKYKVYRKSFTTTKNTMERDVIPFPWSFDFSKYLVSVMVKVSKKTDINDGMVFKSEGSSQARSSSFGGILHVYTNKTLLLYQPYASNGHLIYVGNEFGSNTHGVTADEVEVEVVVYHLSVLKVPTAFLFETQTIIGY